MSSDKAHVCDGENSNYNQVTYVQYALISISFTHRAQIPLLARI